MYVSALGGVLDLPWSLWHFDFGLFCALFALRLSTTLIVALSWELFERAPWHYLDDPNWNNSVADVVVAVAAWLLVTAALHGRRLRK